MDVWLRSAQTVHYCHSGGEGGRRRDFQNSLVESIGFFVCDAIIVCLSYLTSVLICRCISFPRPAALGFGGGEGGIWKVFF